jgi:hypothetical protein
MFHGTKGNQRVQHVIENARSRLGRSASERIGFAREVDKLDLGASVGAKKLSQALKEEASVDVDRVILGVE